MKRGLKILSVFALIVMTTGCMKLDANMTIKNDKSVDLNTTFAMNKKVFEAFSNENGTENTDISDEQRKNAEDKGYKLQKYEDSNMIGYTATKTVPDIDQISKTGKVVGDLGIFNDDNDTKYLFSVKKGFLKNTYTATLKSSDVDTVNEQVDEQETLEDNDATQTDSQNSQTTNQATDNNGASTDNQNSQTTDNANAQNSNQNTQTTDTTQANNTTQANAQNSNTGTNQNNSMATIKPGDNITGPVTIVTADGAIMTIAEGVTTTLKEGETVASSKEEANTIAAQRRAAGNTTINGMTTEDAAELQELASTMDMKFSVNLPYKALSHNASKTENDGKTLTWDLMDTKKDTIQFEFELYNMTNIYIAAGIGAFILLLLIIIIISSIRRKHKKANSINDNETKTPSVGSNEQTNFMDIQKEFMSNNEPNLQTTPTEPQPITDSPIGTQPITDSPAGAQPVADSANMNPFPTQSNVMNTPKNDSNGFNFSASLPNISLNNSPAGTPTESPAPASEQPAVPEGNENPSTMNNDASNDSTPTIKPNYFNDSNF